MKKLSDLFYRLFNKLGMIGNMPPIDPIKVLKKIEEMNSIKGVPGAGRWIISDGYHALTALVIQGKQLTFVPDNGIPLKTFLNTETGEIKIFDARIFKVSA